MMSDLTSPVLQVQHLGKCYRLFASPRDRLKALLGWANKSEPHWALQNVSFDLMRGQCLGIIGDNGAGKSTLLKLLAGTLQPSHGSVNRVGRVTAILELGAGFHPDFSGRDNLMFAGSFIGLGQSDMLRLADEIIAFSELGDSIDRPVKTYSSGMVVRLAFALVTVVQPEVLIIDEALAVGDQHFQKKCSQRIEAFRQNGCTILFCSHSLYHVRQLCDRVLWLDGGNVRELGDTEAVLASYETHVRLQDSELRPAASSSGTKPIQPDSEVIDNGKVMPGRRASLLNAQIIGLANEATMNPLATLKGSDLVVRVQAISPSDETPSIGVMLEQFQGVGITSVATHAEDAPLTLISSQGGWSTWQTTLTFPDFPLHSGQYSLSFYLFDDRGLIVYDEWKDFIHFRWISPSLTPGLVRLPHTWT